VWQATLTFLHVQLIILYVNQHVVVVKQNEEDIHLKFTIDNLDEPQIPLIASLEFLSKFAVDNLDDLQSSLISSLLCSYPTALFSVSLQKFRDFCS
jgi:hypothetical protein